jgi:hypothetical protein
MVMLRHGSLMITPCAPATASQGTHSVCGMHFAHTNLVNVTKVAEDALPRAIDTLHKIPKRQNGFNALPVAVLAHHGLTMALFACRGFSGEQLSLHTAYPVFACSNPSRKAINIHTTRSMLQ